MNLPVGAAPGADEGERERFTLAEVEKIARLCRHMGYEAAEAIGELRENGDLPLAAALPVSPKPREWTLEPSAEENVRASACHACVIKSVTGPLLVPGERVRVREVLEEDIA